MRNVPVRGGSTTAMVAALVRRIVTQPNAHAVRDQLDVGGAAPGKTGATPPSRHDDQAPTRTNSSTQ